MNEAEQIMKRCQAGTRNYNEANNLHAACYGMIGKLLMKLNELESQEPIGYIDEMGNPILLPTRKIWLDVKDDTAYSAALNTAKSYYGNSLLYPHPPQHTWVGLTDEEIDKIRNTPMSVEGGVGFNIYSYARAIEAKLKQKNGFTEEKNT